jgi:hypothetical protein
MAYPLTGIDRIENVGDGDQMFNVRIVPRGDRQPLRPGHRGTASPGIGGTMEAFAGSAPIALYFEVVK